MVFSSKSLYLVFSSKSLYLCFFKILVFVFFLHYFHQIAAISDPEADGSIGNVVAANAIGVFLGLGFPWLVASIYWGQVEEI